MKQYDIIGIGIGPFNLSLAALSQPIENLTSLFLDQRAGFDWHPNLMLTGTRLQTSFLSDLVTLADPTSQFSYLNFAKKMGRIYPFYIRENFFLLREEYNQYCQWACEQLNNLRFNFKVISIYYDEKNELYTVKGVDTVNKQEQFYVTRYLILGTGTQPWAPQSCLLKDNKNISHSADYLQCRENILKSTDITLIGSGQSAAEIFYNLLTDPGKENYHLRWITRSPRFFPLEYTKLTLEMTSPEYIDYFFNLPENIRYPLISEQKSLYKGINADLINEIYDALYQLNISGKSRVELLTNTTLEAVSSESNKLKLSCYHHETQKHFSLSTEYLVLATGYRYNLPDFLSPIYEQLNWQASKQLSVSRHYSIDIQNRIFAQNIGLESHGLSIPDLGMGCYRNSIILKEILGYAPYLIESKIAFQSFGYPELGIY